MLQLPAEVIERCLLAASLRDIAAVAATCRALHVLVNHAPDQHFWRSLYLRHFDDPRLRWAVDRRGQVFAWDWRGEVQRRERARLILISPNCDAHLDALSEQDRRDVFDALVDVVQSAAPITYDSLSDAPASLNTLWLRETLQRSHGSYFNHPAILDCHVPATPTSPDWMSCFHFQTLIGLPPYLSLLHRQRIHRASQIFGFADENFQASGTTKVWGPFLPGGGIHWRALFSIMALIWGNCPDDALPPYGVESLRPILNVSLDQPHDWAGVEGVWVFYVAILDPNDFFRYNLPSIGPDGTLLPKTPSVFDTSNSLEAASASEFVLRITGQEHSPELSDWPVLRWKGIGHVQLRLEGSVYRARNGITYWTVHSTTPDGTLGWLSEGLQLGGLKSEAGFIGQWCATPNHDSVGPFWSWRISPMTPEMRADPDALPPLHR
ncbi:hypothetical protein EXIGLDRAFT_837914 [Exidia glandulosa HHB12029]|uniref:F-box domain-containing protein n=1 Tax=Exidia glandulosa HHB12029 TaxID=1314781 RepID=A0A165GCD5_EXIGL|nr:hypothetical protein EXIGLDRAFT_837914 [Exidia glandulosa HHB12029]